MKHFVRTAIGAGAVLSLSVALAACSTGDQATSASGSAATGSSDCGSLKTVAPRDADGALDSLSDASKALYNGYPYDIYPSKWADWKPKGPGPYTVGVVFGPLRNAHQQEIYDTLVEDLKASPLVGNVVASTTTSDDASAQIQQYQSVVQQGADIMIYQPVAADAFVAAVDEAAAAGVPSVTAQARVDTPNAINVNPNQYTIAGESISQVLTEMGGKGTILGVHGVPAFSADVTSFDVLKDAISACPDVKLVGEVTGNFDSSAAKSEVLSFLSTYTGDVDGVFQTALMAPGIISAFEESGLPVPPVTDIAAQEGSLGYWINHSDSYQGVGIGQGAAATGNAVAEVALGVLAGGGVKVSDVVLNLPLITDDNLADWADPSWDLSTVGTAPGPDDAPLVTDEYLGEIFNSPIA
ncbi:substrate-binding domain-containing protein [Herbiconiux ginsengi]|uniref:Ribose transport system substrate-binding protein n=1 Tax=Herbiconiux ginsengi TaxID=381665 RepID=A0A1H3TVH9_9MICO|nr:substrate-binding domain-containing protein [Herbiconiux ginsengi]SDZ54087.1 ribose transport system substrate-binding protein [Herbiconiux ginsengi]